MHYITDLLYKRVYCIDKSNFLNTFLKYTVMRRKESSCICFSSRFSNLSNHYVALCKYCASPSRVKRRVHERFLGSKTRAMAGASQSYSTEQLSCLQTTKFDLTIRSNILRKDMRTSWNL